MLNESSIVKILAGTEKSKVLQEIETFGTMCNIDKNEIKAALAVLIAERMVERNRIHSKYLQITNKGKEFLRSNQITDSSEVPYEKDLELFQLLREVRSAASKKFVQPGYIICPDDVLRSVTSIKPKTKEALLKIEGFNDRMFIKIGKEFLEIINDFLTEQEVTPAEVVPVRKANLPKNIKETYELLNRKYSLRDIAALQKLSEPVVSMQIETILEFYPDADISYLAGEDTIEKIKEKVQEGIKDLKLLKDSLPPEIPYSLIRIVLSKIKGMEKKASSSPIQYEL